MSSWVVDGKDSDKMKYWEATVGSAAVTNSLWT